MEKYNKYIKRILACSLSVFLFSACSEDRMDDINKNNNNPLNTEAKYIIVDLCTSSAFRTTGGDLSLYSSIYIEHEAGVHNQMYNAEIRSGEPTSNTTYDNVWRSICSNIKNAKIVISKCSEGGPEVGNDVTLGIAKVLLAYNAAVLTDIFGDVPYFEAGVIDDKGLPVHKQAKVDKQEEIYKDIFKQLDEAIVLFDSEDKSSFGAVRGKDLIYGGDKQLWKKAAYALKARYTMRLLARSNDRNADLNNILLYISKSFSSSKEAFKFNYNGVSTINPLGAFSNSRHALGASQSYINKLNERKDPRLTQIYVSYNKVQKIAYDSIVAAKNGEPNEVQGFYDITCTDYSYAAPTQMMSYHELLFLKAEANARLNKLSDAETDLKNAVAAGLINMENSAESIISAYKINVNFPDSIINDYFTKSVQPLFKASPLSEIMIQKYLAFWGASGESLEAYNDYRRLDALGEHPIKLANPLNASGKFPLRYVYGNSDVSANHYIYELAGDGTYVYKEKVWWAGGTR